VNLRELARAAGFDPEYISWRGEHVASSDETLRMALASIAPQLGIDIERADAIDALERARWRDIVPPVVLAWDGELALTFFVPAEMDGEWECEVILEETANSTASAVSQSGALGGGVSSSGSGVIRAHGRLFDLPADGHAWPGGAVHCRRTARVWLEGQLGYHKGKWRAAGGEGEALVISAPTKAHGQPGYGFKRWGVFAPVFGLASRESGPAGDLRTLRLLMEQVGRRGGKYVAVLPILAAFLDEPYAFSPYSPASRLFWNELYLDLDAFAGELDIRVPAAPPIPVNEPIDYREQYRWRRPVIDQLAHRLAGDPAFLHSIDSWARETGAYDYAAFRAIGERERRGWRSWPAELRDGGPGMAMSREMAWEIAGGAAKERDSVDTHLVAQWLMQSQLEQLHGGDAQLYLDLPVGVNCDAYDVWRYRKLFLLDLAAGAPPDALFLGGQNWGLPPLSPMALRRDRYRYFIRCLRHHMRVSGMLRIDHVMGLWRLYCVPAGRPATDGVYLRYPAEELLAIVTLESRRATCAVAGEDLGTVPDQVRPTMTKHGLFRLHVGQWSFPSDPGKAPDPSPAEAVASLNTHDTATFAGWWRGGDITDQRELGLINADQEAQQRAERERQKAAIHAFAAPNRPGEDTLTEVERMMVAVTTDLAVGPAEIVLASLDDLVLDPVPHNVPGTVSERPNWQRRVQNWSEVLDPDRAPPAAAAAVTALTVARPSS